MGNDEFLQWLKALIYISTTYSYDVPGPVVKYMTDKRIVFALYDAIALIHKYFRPGALYLQVASDPEMDWKRLFVNIMVDLDIDEALDKLRLLDHDWYRTKYNNLPIIFDVEIY